MARKTVIFDKLMGAGRRDLKAVLLFALSVAGTAIGLLLHVLIARLTGKDVYGLYSFLLAGINVGVTIAMLGYDSLAMRVVPVFAGLASGARVTSFVQRASRDIALLAALVGAAGFVLSRFWPDPSISGNAAAVLVAGLGIPVVALVRFRSVVLLALSQPVIATFPERIMRDSLIVGAVLALTAAGIALPAARLLLLVLLSSVFCLGLVEFLIRRGTAGMRPAARAEQAMSAQRWRIDAIYLGLISTAFQLQQRMPVLIGGFLFWTADTAPIAAALALAELIGFPLTAVASVFTPEIARRTARGSLAALGQLYARSLVMSLAGACLLGVALWWLAPLVLALFGKSFTIARPLLGLFVLAQIFRSGFGLASQLLLVRGDHHALFTVHATGGLGTLLLAYGLGKLLGPAGIAVAFATGTFCIYLTLSVIAFRRLGPRFSRSVRRALFLAAPP